MTTQVENLPFANRRRVAWIAQLVNDLFRTLPNYNLKVFNVVFAAVSSWTNNTADACFVGAGVNHSFQASD
jgi:hypothetical protein